MYIYIFKSYVYIYIYICIEVYTQQAQVTSIEQLCTGNMVLALGQCCQSKKHDIPVWELVTRCGWGDMSSTKA